MLHIIFLFESLLDKLLKSRTVNYFLVDIFVIDNLLKEDKSWLRDLRSYAFFLTTEVAALLVLII